MYTNGSMYADLLNKSEISADEVIIGNLILPNLSPDSVPYIDDQNTVQDRVLADGQVLIGQSGGPPINATLTGTSDEILITNGPGSITLSTPQPIGPSSDPSFHNLTVSTINGKIGNDLVTGPASSANSNVASFDGTGGKVIKDSGISQNLLFLKDGSVTATGNFNMGTKEINSIAAIRPSSTNVLVGNSAAVSWGCWKYRAWRFYKCYWK